MLFLDLKQLKIIKEYHYHTSGGTLTLNPTHSLIYMKQQVDSLLATATDNLSDFAHLFEFNIDVEETLSDEDAANFLITCANIITSSLVQYLCIDQKRDREHRLDAPDNLKCIKMSMSSLKKLINCQTKINCLNIIVHLQDLVYILCDERTIETGESEFEYAQ